MKYNLIVIILVLCCVMLLASCSRHPVINDQSVHSESGSATGLSDYSAFLFQQNRGTVSIDGQPPQYNGESFFKSTKYSKNHMEPKTVTILGKTQMVYYDQTIQNSNLPYEIDRFINLQLDNYMFISYRTDTNQIVSFSAKPSYSRFYNSSVTPDSTEKEFIEYAKTVLLEIAGVSTEGWTAAIDKERIPYGFEDGYQTNQQYELESLAESRYTITFRKTIGEIERADRMTVKMTDVGEIVALSAVNYDQAYALFKDVQIDKNRIEEAVWYAFDSIKSSLDITSACIDEVTLIPLNHSLWAKVNVVYKTGEMFNDVSYVLEVARME